MKKPGTNINYVIIDSDHFKGWLKQKKQWTQAKLCKVLGITMQTLHARLRKGRFPREGALALAYLGYRDPEPRLEISKKGNAKTTKPTT